MKKWILLLTLTSLLLVGIGQWSSAQDEDPTSNVQIFFVACEDKAVIELSGEMQAGYDVYYQVFSAAAGGGSPLTSLRRVQVSGSYAVSDSVAYSDGITVGLGQIASATVSIAGESDSTRSLYDTAVNDLQDGCTEPTAPAVSSSDIINPEATEEPSTLPGSGILSPFGGELNPGQPVEPLVKIGARRTPGRTANPGLIFAECDKFPLSNPGVIYDTDDLVVYWSWFAKTPELVQDHINHATYVVTLNGAAFPYVDRSEITQRGRNYWVFYVAHLGGNWRPGTYGVSFNLSWDLPISDGYADFGPGTDYESDYSTCTFEILPNPWDIKVDHRKPPMS